MQTKLVFCNNKNLFNSIDIVPEHWPETAYPHHPYWSASGIFHYIFEAYLENTEWYFKDRCAFNIGGKIAAAAHTYYYIDTLKLQNRGFTVHGENEGGVDEDKIIHLTNSIMINALKSSTVSYIDEPLCSVPPQREVKKMKELALKHWDKIKDQPVAQNEGALRYRNAITPRVLELLYTRGYKLAEEYFPYSEHNTKMLNDFISKFERITKYDKEELAQQFTGIEFHIGRGADLLWEALFISRKDSARISYKHLL